MKKRTIFQAVCLGLSIYFYVFWPWQDYGVLHFVGALSGFVWMCLAMSD